MRNYLMSFLLVLFCFATKAAEPAFPDAAQRQAIANELFSGMESIDAVSVYVRDQTRDVSWQQYKARASAQIVQAHNWQLLTAAIDKVHDGIVNQHSFLLTGDGLNKYRKRAMTWPAIKIGYSWPTLSFFDLANGKDIKSLNGVSVKALFDDYYNLFCASAHKSGCLESFVTALAQGYRFDVLKPALDIGYSDGNIVRLTASPATQPMVKRSKPSCNGLYDGLPLKQRFASEQACLYETKDAFVLKILYFGDWGTQDSDFNCRLVPKGGICGAIRQINAILHKQPAKDLVIDLQNNPGGSENTPWLSAFGRPFKDNFVRFRNVEALRDAQVRGYAFYGNERAEAWYQSLSDADKTTEYLPLRADFCRGDAFCQSTNVALSHHVLLHKRLAIVTNSKCASSCDDLIWRLKTYANAKVYGQEPATDGTYASLDGYLLLTPDGASKSVIAGAGQQPDVGSNLVLAHYRLPVTRTVDLNGKVLEGNANVLDVPLAISKESFQTRTQQNLLNTLAHLAGKTQTRD